MSDRFVGFRFDDQAADAVAAAQEIVGEMITNISDETQANIKQLISDAIKNGQPPYEAAQAIHDLIGLTSAQGQAAMKYRQQMIDNGLDPAKVEEKFQEYSDELLDQRAETIARSEIMDALNTGQDEAWQQAQDEGLLTDEATKQLILTDDACDDCQAVADEGDIPIGDEFEGGDPPIHPRCRCTIGIAHP